MALQATGLVTTATTYPHTLLMQHGDKAPRLCHLRGEQVSPLWKRPVAWLIEKGRAKSPPRKQDKFREEVRPKFQSEATRQVYVQQGRQEINKQCFKEELRDKTNKTPLPLHTNCRDNTALGKVAWHMSETIPYLALFKTCV